MRRVIALLAALGLAVTLSGVGLAAAPAPLATSFVGSFDTVYDGVVVGHIDAQMWPRITGQPVSGWYRAETADGALRSSAQVNVTGFNKGDGYKEVWFSAMETFAGGTYAVFTGHFTDYLDPATPDAVEFYGRPVENLDDGAWETALGERYYFAFTVGKGAFVLTIK